jgi:nucleotide-binding universal stress UspA family protein
MKILVPVDGSAFTKRALAYLAAHEEWLGPQHHYTLLHVVPAVPPRAAAVFSKADLQSYYDEEAEKVFAPLRSFFSQQQLSAEFVAKVGHAAEVIAQVGTDGGHDLVLMGSHGHSSLGNLVLGSVANKVLAQTKLPVLLIR